MTAGHCHCVERPEPGAVCPTCGGVAVVVMPAKPDERQTRMAVLRAVARVIGRR